MIANRYIKVHVINSNARYYRELGYTFNLPEDYITIKTIELPKGSHTDVEVICDLCNKHKTIKYKDYYKITKGLVEPYYCEKCKYKIIKQNYMDTYGVPSNLCLDETKAAIKETCLKKYGCENPLASDEIKEKIKNTNIKKYGCENPFASEEIKEKIKNTNLKKYGVTSPAQNKNIMKKMENTCLEKYGVQNAMQNPVIVKKVRDTLYKNNNVATSKQQLLLHSLYGGHLNYPLEWYNLDIFLEDENLDIEYNGGGHDLCVKLGEISKQDFMIKEIIRSNYIKQNNIKQMIISSSKDYLPSNEVLLKMLSITKEFFKNDPNSYWIEFNIDKSIIRNSQAPKGAYFCFGELYQIKRDDKLKERRFTDE